MIDKILKHYNKHIYFNREMEEKMYRLQKTKEEIEAFKAAQEIWRQKERQELEEENRRIEEFLREKEIKQKELYVCYYMNFMFF